VSAKDAKIEALQAPKGVGGFLPYSRQSLKPTTKSNVLPTVDFVADLSPVFVKSRFKINVISNAVNTPW